MKSDEEVIATDPSVYWVNDGTLNGASTNTKLVSIIIRSVLYFLEHKQPIPLDELFSESEKCLIGENPNIFFEYSPGKMVLIKWVLEEIEKIYPNKFFGNILISTITKQLSKHYGDFDFSQTGCQSQIKRLFDYKYSLKYEKFCDLRTFYMRTYLDVISDILDVFKSLVSAPDDSIAISGPKMTEESAPQRNQVKYCLNNIHPNNMRGKINDLILAFTSNQEKIVILQDFLGEHSFIFDLNADCFKNINIQYHPVLCNFFGWLKEDLRDYLYCQLDSILDTKDKRHRRIVLSRATGMTLEEVGKEHGITRERIRQIEKIYIAKIVRYCSQKKPQYILRAFSEKEGYFNCNDIQMVYRDLSAVMIYLLKNEGPRQCHAPGLTWVPELDGFVIGDTDWYESLKNKIEEFPHRIEGDYFNAVVIEMIKDLEVPLTLEEVRKIITNSYNLRDNVFFKGKLSKGDMYTSILENYYPSGIKVNDDIEMKRFRNFVKEMFGDVELPENDRAIGARIADVTILCGRGKYILPKYIKLDDGLLNRIHDHIIAHDRSTLAIREVFKKFQNELIEKTNIDNYSFLHGVLQYKFGGELDFSKDVVNRNPDERRSIREQIEDYIKNKQAEVTKYELLEKFSGIAGYTIDQAIALNKNLLLWDRASYLHASKLVINQEAKERIKGILDSSVVMGTISSRELFEMIFYKEPKFISDNGIENYNALFSVLNLLFSDRYEFSRPYVALKGSENMNTRDQVREYLSNFDEISLSDLKTYLEDKKIRVLNFSKLVESVSDEYIRADEDLLLKVGSMNISEETYLEIEKNIGVLMGDKGYLSPRLIEEFLLFPNIGRKWTQYLIVSLVKL